jgi:hypothetical protein
MPEGTLERGRLAAFALDVTEATKAQKGAREKAIKR